ncbi:MAG: hypothetical protein Q9196_001729 [Gyalolechia fulgens]
MNMVALHSQEDLERLESDPWGIPTPSESSVTGRKQCLANCDTDDQSSKAWKEGMQSLDIIVRIITREVARPGFANLSTPVGLALKEQLLPEGQEVPIGPLDWSVDALIVGDEPVLRR